MIPMLVFSGVAALLVFLAGRHDQARDPRLTILVLCVLACFPFFSAVLPKFSVLPTPAASGSSTGFPWRIALLLVWGAGSLTMAAQLVFSALGIWKWRRSSLLLECVEGVEVRQLSGVKWPVAAGVIRPMVFLPEEWSEWSADTRRLVLDHELAHHRRRDPLWRWIAAVTCVIYGGNPLVTWMVRRLTVQCEFACDAMVLQMGVPVRRYANLLCDFADARPPTGPVLAMAAGSTLEWRVRRLLNPHPPRGNAGLIVLAGITLTLAGVLSLFVPGKITPEPVSTDDVRMRWAADPFPGEPVGVVVPGR